MRHPGPFRRQHRHSPRVPIFAKIGLRSIRTTYHHALVILDHPQRHPRSPARASSGAASCRAAGWSPGALDMQVPPGSTFFPRPQTSPWRRCSGTAGQEDRQRGAGGTGVAFLGSTWTCASPGGAWPAPDSGRGETWQSLSPLQMALRRQYQRRKIARALDCGGL